MGTVFLLSVAGEGRHACNSHRVAGAHCGPVREGLSLLPPLLPWSSRPPCQSRRHAASAVTRFGVLRSSSPAVRCAPFHPCRSSHVTLATPKPLVHHYAVAALRGGFVFSSSITVGSRATPLLPASSPNTALNHAPFGRWTLRDKAAQRRLALR